MAPFARKNDFEAAKASEEVQKVAADQKEYCNRSLCVIICWIAKIYLQINKMVGYSDTSEVAKNAAEVAQKKEQ